MVAHMDGARRWAVNHPCKPSQASFASEPGTGPSGPAHSFRRGARRLVRGIEPAYRPPRTNFTIQGKVMTCRHTSRTSKVAARKSPHRSTRLRVEGLEGRSVPALVASF